MRSNSECHWKSWWPCAEEEVVEEEEENAAALFFFFVVAVLAEVEVVEGTSTGSRRPAKKTPTIKEV